LQTGGLRVVHHPNPYRGLAFPSLNDLKILLLAKGFPITPALPAAIVDQISKAMLTQQISTLMRIAGPGNCGLAFSGGRV